MQNNQRNVQKNTEQRTPDAQSTQLTPTTENSLDTFLYKERQETEDEFFIDGIDMYVKSIETEFVEREKCRLLSGKEIFSPLGETDSLEPDSV